MSTINLDLISNISNRFRQRFGSAPEFIARAPGRVNLLGEHVDYNDGFVMPAAIDRATYVAFSRSAYNGSRIDAFDLHEHIEFSNESIKLKRQIDGSPLPEWGLYPAGVAQTLIDEGFEPKPIDAFFASDVPRGSGLSSSASVEVAFLTAWQQLGHWSLEKMGQARICQKAEIEYVGVNCGIMDQFASVCGEENKILCLDCQSLDWRTFNFPTGIAIIVADTTVRRKLTAGEYNIRHEECKIALRLLQQKMPQVTSFRDVSIADLDRYTGFLPDSIGKRARHVITEIDRTIKAQAILEQGDIRSFGRLINETHASLRDFYKVSCPELDIMAEIAQSQQGCIGARLTGAGFGGCTVNLVEVDVAESFIRQLSDRYEEATGLTPAVYLTRASNGAEIL
jgi:galactokinase